MHWETSRNQQRFSQIIENIVNKKKRNDRKRQAATRKDRQNEREDFPKPKRPTPSESRSRWDRIREHSQNFIGNSATNMSAQATSSTDEDNQSQWWGPIRSMTPDQLEALKHEPCSECTLNIQKVSRVIMVDQLWMWMLDRKTIITCFPKRYGANKHDTSGIHKSIRMRIEEGRISIHSVFDLALVIFEECSNTFFDWTRTTDKQPQVIT